jgi:COMPASS component SWD3
MHSLFYKNQYDRKLQNQYSLLANDHLIGELKQTKTLKTEENVNGCLFCLEWSPNSDLLACTSGNSIQVWDPLKETIVQEVKGHAEIVTAFEWFKRKPATPKNSLFVSASLDMTIRIHKDYKTVSVLNDHKDWIRCLSLTYDNEYLISGCVSSTIMGWDLEIGKPLWSIKNSHSTNNKPKPPQGGNQSELDTVNSLTFLNDSKNIFLSGARDGLMKIWDTRVLKTPVNSIRAHNSKLNNIECASNDLIILTSGRDNNIRLWDFRRLEQNETHARMPVLKEFNKHACSGYNIGAHFYNSQKNIITGSEDKSIYIYDIESGELKQSLTTNQHILHLVRPRDAYSLEFTSSSIDSGTISIWSPSKDDQPTAIITEEEQESDTLMATHRIAVESLMRKYGDQLLLIFHRHNVTFSSMDWSSTMQAVPDEGDSNDLGEIGTQMADDILKAMEFCEREGNDPQKLSEYLSNMTISPSTTTSTTTTSTSTTSTINSPSPTLNITSPSSFSMDCIEQNQIIETALTYSFDPLVGEYVEAFLPTVELLKNQ